MLDKAIRDAMKIPAPPKNPYAALMDPMVIVPDDPEEKVVIADAGSIIKLMDQSTLYRDRTSPITRRSDELLVQYGKADKPKLGWLTNKQPPKIMKPSTGPTFLVNTKSEDGLMSWERLRLMVARTRKSDPTNWLAPWLATHGSKHSKLLKEVTKYFGGKPVKNEGTDARCIRLFQLILNAELDMATAKSSKTKVKSGKSKGKNKKQSAAVEEPATKKGKSKKTQKVKSEKVEKKGKAKKTSKKSGASDRITKAMDDFVIKQLVKENPRRAGSEKAKIWSKLKKGMTVADFIKKGGNRGAVRVYIQNGWIKLLEK